MAIQAQLHQDNFGSCLGGSQYWMPNTYGFNEFCFPKQQQQIADQKAQNPCFYNKECQSRAFSENMGIRSENQRQEVDQLLSLQNERLKLALEEQRNQQVSSILRKFEAKMEILMKQKDQEIKKGMNRNLELKDFLRRIEIESQTWQRVAEENEAMVESLNSAIEQIRENAHLTNRIEDSESCCDMIYRDCETERIRGNEEERETEVICKSCNSRNSCVMFLPCRHLCSCDSCQSILDSCPICGMVKKASIEALF